MVYLKSLIDIVGIVLETLACLSFFDVVYKNKRLNSTKNFYTCIFVYIILHSCISIFVSDSNLKLVFFFCIIFSLSFIYKAKFVQRILYSFLLLIIIVICEIVAGLMLSLITRQSISDDSDHLAYYFAATLASKILAFVIAKILIIYKKQTSSNVSLLWLLPFSLLPIGTLIAIFVLTGYMYSQSEIYIIIAVLISDALLVVSNIAFFYLFEQMQKQYQEGLQTKLINQQIIGQMEYFRDLSEQQRISNKALHDLKHTMIVICDKIKHEDPDINEKIEGIYNEIMRGQTVINTGNTAFDALVNMKYILMKERNINFKPIIQMEQGSLVNDFDMCALLGNLLDNAIEACEKIENHDMRFIDLRINFDKDVFNIVIKNSVTQKVNIDKNMNFNTDKINPEAHEIGTQSIKSIVKKYNGECFFESTQDVFTARILMNIGERNTE